MVFVRQGQDGSGNFLSCFLPTHRYELIKTDKMFRNAIVGKREGMSNELLFQILAVHTDGFNISGFASNTTERRVNVKLK